MSCGLQCQVCASAGPSVRCQGRWIAEDVIPASARDEYQCGRRAYVRDVRSTISQARKPHCFTYFYLIFINAPSFRQKFAYMMVWCTF